MVFSILRAIFGLLLTLFIPGFAVTLVVFPKEGRVEKIALSCVLSIATVLLMALFLDLVLGVDMTAENMVIALVSFSLLFFLIYFIQGRRHRKPSESQGFANVHVVTLLRDKLKIKLEE